MKTLIYVILILHNKKDPLKKFDTGHWIELSTQGIIILTIFALFFSWVIFAWYHSRKLMYTKEWAENMLNYDHERDFREKFFKYSNEMRAYVDLHFGKKFKKENIIFIKKILDLVIELILMFNHFFIVGFMTSFILMGFLGQYISKVFALIKLSTLGVLINLANILSYNKSCLLIPEFILALWIFVLIVLSLAKFKTLKKKPSYIYANVLRETFRVFYFVALVLIFFVTLLTLNKKNLVYSFFMFDIYTLLSKFFFICILMGVLSCVQISYKRSRTNFFELPLLSTFLTLFSFLAISSFDLWAVLICLEGVSLCVVFLIAFNYYSEDSSYYALKYLVLSSVSSGLLAFGSSVIFGVVTSSNFELINKFCRNMIFINNLQQKALKNIPLDLPLISPHGLNSASILVSFGLILIILAFLFKLGAAPLHQITITIYKNSTWGIMFVLSIGLKLVLLSIFRRLLFYVFYDFRSVWTQFVQLAAIMSIIVGTFGAFGSKNLKEFFSYSSLVHLSWMLLSISTGLIEGLVSFLVFTLYYTISMSAIFLVLNSTLSKNDSFPITGFNDLKQVRFNSRFKLTVFVISILNLTGLPPFPGFFAKILLINSLMISGFYITTLLLMSLQILAYFYYIRLILLCFSDYNDSENIFTSQQYHFQNIIIHYFVHGYNYDVALNIAAQLVFFSFPTIFFMKKIISIATLVAKSCVLI